MKQRLRWFHPKRAGSSQKVLHILSKSSLTNIFTVTERVIETWKQVFSPKLFCYDPNSNLFFSTCLSVAVYFLFFPLVKLSPVKPSAPPFLCYTLLWLISSRDGEERAGQSFLHREDCLSRPIICCYIGPCVSLCVYIVCLWVCVQPNLFL